MAKQNFIAGGYYGKLGETVGQRWKNIRTIRVYVIPHDPKTPAQMACRGVFSQGVPYAQQGMRINKGAPCWNYENKTEWQARMGTAVDRLRNGVTGDAVIPIFPDGYTPDTVLMGISFIDMGGGLYAFKCRSSPILSTERKALVVVECNVPGQTQTVDVFLEVDLLASGSTLFMCDFGTYSPKDGGQIYGVTTDDNANDGKMVYIAIQAMTQAVVIPVSDWVFSSWFAGNPRLSSSRVGEIAGTYERSFVFMTWDVFRQQALAYETSATVGNSQTLVMFGGLPDTVTLFEGAYVKGKGDASITEGDNTYTFPEIPLAVNTPRDIEGTAWGGSMSATMDVERNPADGETLIYIDIVYPQEFPDNAVDVAVANVPNNMYVTGTEGGSTFSTYIDPDDSYVENDRGKTHLKINAVISGHILDLGSTCRVRTGNITFTTQNARLLSREDDFTATVVDA